MPHNQQAHEGQGEVFQPLAFGEDVAGGLEAAGWVTNQLAQGDYTPRARVSSGDEIGELAANFNRMACAIEKNIQELEDGNGAYPRSR